ncbi:MAG: hypothetical protein WCH34_12605 [Bacteroidota bacterium]
MNWFTKLFRRKTISQADLDSIEACNAYLAGEKLWKDSILPDEQFSKLLSNEVLPYEPLELKKNKALEALKLFDKAIEKGFEEEPEIFSMRGSILNDLGFYFEALEDYNKAISGKPQKGIANNYFMRSYIKESIYDFDVVSLT